MALGATATTAAMPITAFATTQESKLNMARSTSKHVAPREHENTKVAAKDTKTLYHIMLLRALTQFYKLPH